MCDNVIDYELFASNIEYLAQKIGVSKNKALIDSGAGKDFIVNMINKNQVPSLLKVVQLAQYFGVSVDYLLGYTPNEQSDGKTEKLLTFASKLTDEQLDAFIESYSRILEQLK